MPRRTSVSPPVLRTFCATSSCGSGCAGRGEGWEQGDFQAFIKLGSDGSNFYLYRAPARSTTWEPEFAIDLEVWRSLRADIESRWLSGAPPPARPSAAAWT